MKRSFKFILAIILSSHGIAYAGTPQVYNQAFHQSPVSGGPNDLILIAGSGFSATDLVVYRQGTVLKPPTTIPPTPSQFVGFAKVGVQNVPYSLTVILPSVILKGSPYVLWVRNAAGEWSKLNRPGFLGGLLL